MIFLLTTLGPRYIINLCLKLEGGDQLTARKKPGPHPEKPLEIEVKARVDKETFEQLRYGWLPILSGKEGIRNGFDTKGVVGGCGWPA